MSNLRNNFSSIIKGKTPFLWNDQIVFAKHHGFHDGVEVDFVYSRELERTKSLGIDSEKDRLMFLESEGLWSQDEEKKIAEIKLSIENLKVSKKNVLLPSYKNEVSNNIKKLEEELLEKLYDRECLVGQTQESFAKNESEIYFILHTIFKDPDLEELLIPESEHESVEDSIIFSLISAYNKALNFLNSGGVKKVALSGEAQMLISLAENAYHFYGRPVSSLTFFQSELFIYAKNYAQMLKSEVAPPDGVREDPEKLEDWFDSVTSSKKVIKDTGNTSLVGGSFDDIKQITGGEILDMDSEIKKAAEANNGIVSMESLMKILA
jgi:hypothetical protein